MFIAWFGINVTVLALFKPVCVFLIVFIFMCVCAGVRDGMHLIKHAIRRGTLCVSLYVFNSLLLWHNDTRALLLFKQPSIYYLGLCCDVMGIN